MQITSPCALATPSAVLASEMSFQSMLVPVEPTLVPKSSPTLAIRLISVCSFVCTRSMAKAETPTMPRAT